MVPPPPESRSTAARRALGIALAVMLLLAAGAALAQVVPGSLSGANGEAAFRAAVVAVGDGDSLRVRREGEERPIRLRLACIDAPELQQRPWGSAARDALRLRLPRGRSVLVLPHDRDRYGRIVAEVISDLNINLVMVEDGQAFVVRRHLAQCDGREYLQAEFRASRHRYGIWRQPGGITRPWEFRRAQHDTGRQAQGSGADRSLPAPQQGQEGGAERDPPR